MHEANDLGPYPYGEQNIGINIGKKPENVWIVDGIPMRFTLRACRLHGICFRGCALEW